MKIHRSSIFETIIRIDTCLELFRSDLFPFLYTGLTQDCFQISGKVAVCLILQKT